MDKINIYILLLVILKAGVATTKEIPNYSISGNRYSRQVSGNGCQIPVDPHGQYKIVNNSGQFTAETYAVNEFTLVILNCDTSYKKSPPGFKYSLCENGLWSPLYKCESTCSTLSSTKSTKIRCYFNNVQLESCESPLDGTVAEYDCQPYYENYLSGNSFVECHRGAWIGIKHECSPICGEKRSVGTPNIINGTNARKGSYPWQVAIYKINKEFICGGSIISQKIILTAAHCLCESDDGTSCPKHNYVVAVGKHYRAYDDSRDIGAQYPMIESIHAPNQYRGDILQYESDIAVIILTNNLVLSDVVQPICVDWFGRYESEQLMLNNKGVVTGWGYTVEGDNLSDELKELNVPYIPYDQCFRQVPNNFTKYVRSDKICSGYLDLGTSVCQGDSGGALAFPLLFNGKYYVRGIVSVSPATTDNTCNSHQYGLYTSLSKYLNFVRGFYYLTNELFSKSESTPLTTPSPTINNNVKDSNNEDCSCGTTNECCPDGVHKARGNNLERCEEAPVNLQTSCSFPKDRGSCKNNTVKWFFDLEYGGCSRFWYGGCDGNANQFKSKEECNEICVEPQGKNRCALPKTSGACDGYYPQWYYSTELKSCYEFIYSGCLGNNNKFETREECLDLCVKTTNSESEERCKTPDNKHGTCITTRDCQPLIQFIRSNTPLTSYQQTKLREYQCKVFDSSNVCCPDSSLIIPTSEDIENRPNLRLLPPECGIPKVSYRIYNGQTTRINQYAWMALLAFQNTKLESQLQFKCGGSIISNRYILTAANCLINTEPIGIRAGEHRISTTKDCEQDDDGELICAPPVQDVNIEEVIPHPSFNRTKNDIGLIRLATPLNITDNVQPICLPTVSDLINFNLTGRKLKLLGFGRTETGESSDVLLQAKIPVILDEECRNTYSTTRINITDSQLSAGVRQGTDSCAGDMVDIYKVLIFLA